MKAFDISTSRQYARYARESRPVSRRKTGQLAAQGGSTYREWPPAILVASRAAFARQGTLPSRAEAVLQHRVERRHCSEPGDGPWFTGSDVVIINRLVREAGWEVAARAAEDGYGTRGSKPDLSINLRPVGDSQDGLSALSSYDDRRPWRRMEKELMVRSGVTSQH